VWRRRRGGAARRGPRVIQITRDARWAPARRAGWPARASCARRRRGHVL